MLLNEKLLCRDILKSSLGNGKEHLIRLLNNYDARLPEFLPFVSVLSAQKSFPVDGQKLLDAELHGVLTSCCAISLHPMY